MQHRSLFLLAGVITSALLACDDGEFSGSHDSLRFRSNLGAPWRSWTPAVPVATGTAVDVDAVDEVGSDPGPVHPEATVTVVDDDAIFADVEVDTDAFDATVADVGTATVTFAGRRTDDVVINALPLDRTQILDPVRDFAGARGFVQEVDLALVPEVTSPLALTAGARLALGAGLFAADDVVIATNSARVGFAAAGDVAISGGDHAVTVSVPDVVGAAGQLSLLIDGAPSSSIDIEAHAASEAATLDVIDVHASGIRAVQAIVRLADGSVLWQAPVSWELDPRLSAIDQAALGDDVIGTPFDPVRNDLLLFGASSDAEGSFDADITAHLGELQQTITVSVVAREAQPPADTEPESPESCGGCAASAPTSSFWAPAALLGLWLRRRATGLSTSVGAKRRSRT